MLYDITRGIADGFGRPIHVTEPLTRRSGCSTAWSRRSGCRSSSTTRRRSVVRRLVALVYCSHFVVVWAYAAVLYLRNRERWGQWARRILLLSYAGL